MLDGKSAVGSVTIIGAVVAVAAGAAQMVGYSISATDQEAIVNLVNSGLTVITSIATIVGGVIAIWGRVRATKQITGVVRPS